MRDGRARLIVVGVACLALVVAFAFTHVFRPVHSNVDAPPPLVTHLLVLPFGGSGAQSFGRDVGVEVADEIADSLAYHVEAVENFRAGPLPTRLRPSIRAQWKQDASWVSMRFSNGKRLRRGPGQLKVTARLTATRDGRVLWNRAYVRQSADIFAAQNSTPARSFMNYSAY